MYNLIVRPLLFLIDPEKVHRMLLNWLRIYRYLLPVRACVRGHYQVDEPFFIRKSAIQKPDRLVCRIR